MFRQRENSSIDLYRINENSDLINSTYSEKYSSGGNKKRNYNLFYVSSFFFYLAAAGGFLSHNPGIGAILTSLGSLYLILGVTRNNK
jgi:hypothetical protein